MASNTFRQKQRVALAENPSIRGYVYNVNAPYAHDDATLYSVQWDKDGVYMYLGEMLITEEEAVKLEAANKLAIENKFKSIEKKAEESK